MTMLEVLYSDAQLAVINKPAGLMVHDSKLARGETDFAADRLREQFGKPIFLVHRLDRATSGCLLLAFDRERGGRARLGFSTNAPRTFGMTVRKGF